MSKSLTVQSPVDAVACCTPLSSEPTISHHLKVLRGAHLIDPAVTA